MDVYIGWRNEMAHEFFALRLKPELAECIEEEARINHTTMEQTIIDVLAAWYAFHGPIAEEQRNGQGN